MTEIFKTDGLTPMQLGRLNAFLDKPVLYGGRVTNHRQILVDMAQRGELCCEQTDGQFKYSRSKFNSLDYNDQARYMQALKAQTHYFAGDLSIPKIVFDALSQFHGT